MIETTNRALFVFQNSGALSALHSAPLPGLLAYRVALLLQAAQAQLQVVEQARQAIVARLELGDEITWEQREAYVAELEPVLAQQVDLAAEPVAVDELVAALEGSTMSPAMWLAIRDLLA